LDYFSAFLEEMIAIVNEYRRYPLFESIEIKDEYYKDPIGFISYISRTFFGCEPFFPVMSAEK